MIFAYFSLEGKMNHFPPPAIKELLFHLLSTAHSIGKQVAFYKKEGLETQIKPAYKYLTSQHDSVDTLQDVTHAVFVAGECEELPKVFDQFKSKFPNAKTIVFDQRGLAFYSGSENPIDLQENGFVEVFNEFIK